MVGHWLVLAESHVRANMLRVTEIEGYVTRRPLGPNYTKLARALRQARSAAFHSGLNFPPPLPVTLRRYEAGFAPGCTPGYLYRTPSIVRPSTHALEIRRSATALDAFPPRRQFSPAWGTLASQNNNRS